MKEGELGKEVGGDISDDDGGVAADEAMELKNREASTAVEKVEDGIRLHRGGEWGGGTKSGEEAPASNAREEGRGAIDHQRVWRGGGGLEEAQATRGWHGGAADDQGFGTVGRRRHWSHGGGVGRGGTRSGGGTGAEGVVVVA
uniref:Glycine-rich RNA-binding protein 10-like n=1 Tax=Elaeis guineensis var. tenera TaxID=51953 RepID=A0A6I9QTE1_ELAGV|nr:glycine-rich RNA-binding protein 10-like [Elaeis guineensis]